MTVGSAEVGSGGVRRHRQTFLAAAASVVTGMVGVALALGVSPLPMEAAAVAATAHPEVPVSATDHSAEVAANSPILLVDPTEPAFLVAAHRFDAPDFGCALQLSGDGGRSWIPARPVAELPEGAEKCYAPEVAFDGRGVLYYLFVGLAGGGNEPMGAFLTHSSDRGRTFATPRKILGPLNFAVRMAIDPTIGDRGRIHLVWLHATSDPILGGFGPPPNPILAAYSDDGGRRFSEPVPVSDADRPLVVAPGLALGPDHSVHVAYYDLRDDERDYRGLEGPVWDGRWSVLMASSTNGGREFAPAVVVEPAVVPPERPILIFTMAPPALVVGRDERSCLAWTDARHGDADVFLRCEGDDGSWRPVRRLNDDVVGNGAAQYLPRLALSPGGRLDAVYYDRRADPANIGTHVSFTSSSDGRRQRFSPTLVLTAEPSNSRIGQQYANKSAEGQVEMGSRLGLVSLPDQAVVAWADTRNSYRSSIAQAVMATQVDVAAPGEGRGSRVAGLGLIGVAAVGGAAAAFRARSLR